MSLWTSIRNLLTRRVKPETSRIYSYGPTTGGERIDGERALRQSVVWACLSYLSRTVAQLPWKILYESGDGTEEAKTHPTGRVLRLRANPEMSAFTFKEMMVWWAASYGNAVAELEKDMRGVVTGMYPIEPWRLTIDRDRDTRQLYYEVSNEEGDKRRLRPDEVFHLRGFGHGAVGLDVVSYAAESIGWARATEVFGAAFFGQGMAPSGIIQTKGKLTPDGLTYLKEEVKREFGGAKNSHRTLVLDVDMEFKPLANTPATSQLIETRQHQVEEICRWFGVPPHKVMHLLRSTFSNIEHQAIEVVVDSITPWVLRLEQEADWKLFGQNREGLFTKLEMKGLLRGDYKTRQEGLQIMRRNGVITTNEWRALEDMNPIGADGEKMIVEANMTTLEKVGEEPEPAPAAGAAPAAPDDGEEDNVIDALAWRRRVTK